jgi:fatty-acyl-CoA synthase
MVPHSCNVAIIVDNLTLYVESREDAMFAEQFDALCGHARSTPDTAALTYRGHTVTYRELLEQVEANTSMLAPSPAPAYIARLGSSIHDVSLFLALTRLGRPILALDDAIPAFRIQELLQLLELGSVRWASSSLALAATDGLLNTPDSSIGYLTSGTTGPESVVIHDERSLSRSMTTLLNPALVSSNVWHQTMRLPSIAGVVVAARVLISGDHLVLASSFEPRSIISDCLRYNVSLLSLPPTLLEHLCRLVGRIDLNLPALRVISCGAAPISSELRDRASKIFGVPVNSAYGSTELGGPVMTSLPSDAPRFRVMSGVQVRIHPPGVDSGELEFRVSPCYVRRIDGTTGQVEPPPPDGWIRTGDRGAITSDGLVEFHGRDDEIVYVGGEKVNCAEVTGFLESLPMISRAVVRQRGDGTGIEGFVMIEPNHDAEAALLTVRQILTSQLAAYKIPSLSVVDSFPVTPNLKVRAYLVGS